MVEKDRLLKYKWLIDLLRASKSGLTFDEINRAYFHNQSLSQGLEMSKPTFKRYKRSIMELYKIDIECDEKHGYKYYIRNIDELKRDNVQQFMLRSVAIGDALSNSESIYDRILIEPMPSNYFLELIIISMKQSAKIEIVYQDYGKEEEEPVVVEPYALKTYHHRWYLLAKMEDGCMRIFCLDRVNKVAQTKDRFVYDDTFDARHYFAEFYAVRLDRDRDVQRVVIRAHENERFIIDRQPIHWSQRKIADGVNYADFELKLRPTFDFVIYLESQGRFVEVVEPQWLRGELVRVHREAIERNKIV